MGRSPSLCAMTTTRPARAPIVERVAGWSARHRKNAVFGWLLLVIAALVIGPRARPGQRDSYEPGQGGRGRRGGAGRLASDDPGRAGRAERVLNRPVVRQPAAESVLVQGRTAGQTYGQDPEVREAVRQVVAALRARPDRSEEG